MSNKQVNNVLFSSAGGGHADLEVGDQFGRSPLMYCVLADRLECAEILLKAGAQVNLRDKGGRTALHWAAHKVWFILSLCKINLLFTTCDVEC